MNGTAVIPPETALTKVSQTYDYAYRWNAWDLICPDLAKFTKKLNKAALSKYSLSIRSS
jgi:hypothetical protein